MRPRSVPLQCRQDEDLQVDQRDGNSEAREIELKLIAGSIWTKGDLLALQLAAGRPLSPLATAYLLARDDEENDSENPRNWSRARKWSATIVVSLQVFLATFGVAHLAPALGYISKDLGIHSGIQRGAIIAVYIASFSIAHLIHSPISEAWGRRPVLVGGLVIYLLFNSLCAIATNTRTLLAFRFFSGVGACAPLGTGGAVLIDLWHPDDRALALSIFSIAPQLGPLVGPIMGGYMTQQLGDSWRLGLGLTSAAIAIALGATVLLVPETLAARIPHLRARELRAEQGVKALCAAYEQTERSAAPFAAEVVLRPIILLSCEPAIQLAATHLGVCFSVFYLMATTFPAVYGTCYGEKPGIASLHYIAIFVGTMIGAALSSRSLHLNRGCAPESKFRPLMWFGCFPTCGMLVYGWSTCNGLHWLLADLGVTVFACGLAVSVVIVQSYLAECYSLLAASALSASVLTRSLLGFAAPLLGETLYHHLGLGWGNTLLAVFAGLVGIPLPFIMLRHGQAFRLASRYATKSSDIESDPCAQSS
ncbi:Synaptic vesicle transporter SVOP and related transporters (major facilitator superfamily) [Ceraceosorus bombacis]|uniref:Synaptic vesicle transporter SVOP and related transporters (Major facilitator superfamily) n=1 Tax=Ceraceosorus bombacis TaxID=401625 RepID=A0A0P1BHK6_9BASI|nr:Synaptic vesicle transporter SVOP and related transporters (major facilitator superfamily) [Ceraceosorus bombacis]